jgi:hypothetical protein
MKVMKTISLLLLALGVLSVLGCPEPTGSTPPPTYTVTYDGNDSTSGDVPVDAAEYEQGKSVTVLGNSGGLAKSDPSGPFRDWNTAADGSGDSYHLGDTLLMGGEDLTLYARYYDADYALRGTGPAGGLIFHVNTDYEIDGWRYLEAAPADCNAGAGIQWWTGENLGSGAYYSAIGTGQANTTLILAAQGVDSSGYAADACDSLSVDGCSDWFLPSKDELNEMYVQLKLNAVGGFAESEYWSSSAQSMSLVNMQRFSDGWVNPENSAGAYKVRAVRAF